MTFHATESTPRERIPEAQKSGEAHVGAFKEVQDQHASYRDVASSAPHAQVWNLKAAEYPRSLDFSVPILVNAKYSPPYESGAANSKVSDQQGNSGDKFQASSIAEGQDKKPDYEALLKKSSLIGYPEDHGDPDGRQKFQDSLPDFAANGGKTVILEGLSSSHNKELSRYVQLVHDRDTGRELTPDEKVELEKDKKVLETDLSHEWTLAMISKPFKIILTNR